MDRMMTRHPLSALWGDLAPSDLASMRESIQEYGFTDPVIWTYGGAVLDGWHRYTLANLLDLELEVREYDGDPVQWVIGRNLHRRHLTALQRVSCVSAALKWAKQGEQKSLDRDEDTGQFTMGAHIADMVEPAPTSLTQPDSSCVTVSPIPAKLAGMGEPEPTSLIQPGAGPNHHRCQLGTYGD